jgi:cell division transport system ATP-binding protein
MSRNPGAAAIETQTLFAEPAIVAFDGVAMRYGRAPEVLSNLNLRLERGSFHFVTGASGAGKSSLLKLMYLAHKASRGRVELFGHDVSLAGRRELPSLRRRIGVVFQEFRLMDHLSAFDNAALPLRIAGRRPATYRDDVAELLNWVGLGDRMHAPPPTLSGGEKQRLAIARAVIARPDLLLADEPTGNVDPAMSLRILRLFVELNRMGTTILIASHDEDLVAASGRPVLHLEKGRLVDLDRAGPDEADPEDGSWS